MNPQQNRSYTGSVVAQYNQDRCDKSSHLRVTEELVKKGRGSWSPYLPAAVELAKNGKHQHLRQLIVATYNVRTLNDTICTETGELITHKLDRIIADCERYDIDLIALQEHRLHTNDQIEFSYYHQHDKWTLAHTNSTSKCQRPP